MAARNSIPSQQITIDARDALNRNLARMQALLLAPIMSGDGLGHLKDTGKGDDLDYLDAIHTFVVDCQDALKASDALQIGKTSAAPPASTASGSAPPSQFSTPITIERDQLEMINNALLIGLAAHAEVGRLHDTIEFAKKHANGNIGDDVRVIASPDGATGEFANALHLTAQALDVARQS